MPHADAMKKIIRRQRAAVKAVPPEPVSQASLVIPEPYLTYGDGERFLLYDSSLGDEDQILIFGRQSHGAWSTHMRAL
ncbi:hypothetical protein M513_08362 [Trichuris suis]|uniref:Uncharacterized protein n=1 Tax=Trichuris suis TaxID=68888 RepID=A0A085M0G0_9BILA|nr:hypothetical protein M513_08362 [Trichuris suis]